MYIYESHLSGLYTSDDNLDFDELWSSEDLIDGIDVY